MIINRDSKWYKWYIFGFYTSRGKFIAERQSIISLCSLINRCFIFAPLKALFFITVIAGIITLLFINPIVQFGFLHTVIVYVALIIAVAGIMGIIFGSVTIYDKLKYYYDKLKYYYENKEIDPNKQPGFIISYYHAFKDKVCPLIIVKDNEENK